MGTMAFVGRCIAIHTSGRAVCVGPPELHTYKAISLFEEARCASTKREREGARLMARDSAGRKPAAGTHQCKNHTTTHECVKCHGCHRGMRGK